MCRSLFHQNWQCLRRRREAVSDPFFLSRRTWQHRFLSGCRTPYCLTQSYTSLPQRQTGVSHSSVSCRPVPTTWNQVTRSVKS